MKYTKELKQTFAVTLYLAVFAMACQGLNQTKKIQGGAGGGNQGTSGNLEAKAKDCGAALSQGKAEAKGDDGTQSLALNYQMSICGSLDGTKETEWHALGASVLSHSIFINKSKDGTYLADDESKGEIFIKGSDVIIVQDGRKTVIGKISSVGEGELVEAAPGVTFTLVADGEAYKVGHPGMKTAEKSVWVTLK